MQKGGQHPQEAYMTRVASADLSSSPTFGPGGRGSLRPRTELGTETESNRWSCGVEVEVEAFGLRENCHPCRTVELCKVIPMAKLYPCRV